MKTSKHFSRPTINPASTTRTLTPARTRRSVLAASANSAAASRGKVPSVPARVPVSSRATGGVQVKRKLSVSTRAAGRLPNESVAAKRERTETNARLATVTPTLAARIRSKSRRSTTAASRATPKRMQAASSVDTAFGCAASQEREKAELERRVVELASNVQNKQTEIVNLKMEIGRMKEQQQSRNEMVLLEVENLRAENAVLRQRLEELGPPINEAALCDSDKVILLQKKCNSAPPSLTGSHVSPPLCGPGVAEARVDSIGMEQLDADAELRAGATGGGDMDRAPSDRGSLEWDKQSNSSVSEMSVACLQDRILQMEETHYSTSEELQATLQELSDMQDQLAELQTDNERLAEEKTVILESLCKQTMRLEEYKVMNEDLRQMLCEQSTGAPSDESQRSERERRLVELAANVEKEKERLTRERSELMQALRAADTEVEEQRREAAIASEKARLAVLDADDLRRQRKAYFEGRGGKTAFEEQVEVARLQEMLDLEKADVAELLKGQMQMQSDGAELEKRLDGTQVEKDNIEAAHTVLQGQLMQYQNENERLHEQLLAVQKESAVTVNKLEARLNESQMKLDEATSEKKMMQHELVALQQEYREMERRCEHHLEDRRDLRATISDLQKKLNEASGRVETLDRQLDDVRRKRDTETKEWEQFQNDLLMTVRVANDFKTEAQQDVEKLVVDNAALRDRVKSLQAENERLKAMKTTTSPPGERRIMTSSPTTSFPRAAEMALAGVDPEAVSLRRTRAAAARAGDNRQSVRSLIESIENASKPGKEDAAGTTSPPTSPVPPAVLSPVVQRAHGSKNEKGPNRPASIDDTLLSRDQTMTQQSPPRSSLRNSYTEGTGAAAAAAAAPRMSPEKVVPSPPNVRCNSSTENGKSQSPVSILTNKLELTKRGSYGDAADKKDPLAILAKGGGSKRNALLKWCQNKTVGYKGIDITNFSSSWNDGLALCALLHTYLPNKIPYEELDGKDKRRNFTLAFSAAESVGIPTILNIGDMISVERPDWQSVMCYVTSIYKLFEM